MGGSGKALQQRAICGHPQTGEGLGGVVGRLSRQRKLHVEVHSA